MASARPLRDVFADLAGAPGAADDPAALLRDHGHPELPDDLVAEAVVSYADTAPVEVAEHLAPYVTAHSAVGADPAAGDETAVGWLDLLGTAPAGDSADIDDLPPATDGFDDDGLDLGFGLGAGPEPSAAAGAEAEDGDEPVEILADPAGLDEDSDVADWTPAEPAAVATTGEFADGIDDDAEPDGDALG
ncbi:MAG TPA: hypothetical protein VFH03_20475 [Actinoplanes sp.]|nr:hypothetical protein [Actinoplanes sp.]